MESTIRVQARVSWSFVTRDGDTAHFAVSRTPDMGDKVQEMPSRSLTEIP